MKKVNKIKKASQKADLRVIIHYLAVVDSTVVSAPDSLEDSFADLSFADSTALEASLAADSAALEISLPADLAALEASLAADSTALEASALGALEPQPVKASIATAATANNLNFNILIPPLIDTNLCLLTKTDFIPVFQKCQT